MNPYDINIAEKMKQDTALNIFNITEKTHTINLHKETISVLQKRYELPTLTISEALATEPPTTPWLIEDWIPEGCVGMIQGHPGSGKSYFSLFLALAMASGTSIHHFKPVTGIRARYLSFEDDQPVIHKRLQRMPFDKNTLNGADFTTLFARSKSFLVKKSDGIKLNELFLQLKEELKQHKKPTVIFIDHWSASLQGFKDENSATEQADALRVLDKLSIETGATIILIHHLGKGNSGGIYASRGSSVLAGNTRFILHVGKPDDSLLEDMQQEANGTFIEVQTIKLSYAKKPSNMYFRISNSGYFYPIDVDNSDYTVKEIANGVLDSLTQSKSSLSFNELLSKKQFKAILKKLKIPLSDKRKIRHLLNKAVEQGLISSRPEDKENKKGRKLILYGGTDA